MLQVFYVHCYNTGTFAPLSSKLPICNLIIGHGKLSLGDGGYYEGTFAYGEIEGHGYRVFGLTGATYSGQFHRGEMHGQGILQYPNGELYEGSWAKGRKEGELFSASYCIV